MFLLISLLFFITGSSYIKFFASFFEPIERLNYDDTSDDEEEEKPEIKYEDKYWDLFRRVKNEHTYSKALANQKCEELTKTIPEEIRKAEQDMEDFADMVDAEKCAAMQAKLDQLRQMDPATEATKFAIAQRLEQLATCVLFETTPVGNVIMTYNAKKEVFEYYSDCTVPYRYLDTACRKYVLTFGCTPLYVDMNEEVKVSEAKTKQLREEKAKEKEKEKDNMKDPPKKKNVFAKFKTYNKDSGLGGAPPKNSLPGGQKVEDSEPVIVKERTNKFLFLGKTMNFNTGKKVARKETNKKLSFADFKKMSKK
jgi:hypothetical protein